MRSYNVQIWVGLRIGYSNEFHTLDDVRAICDAYISEINDCITITPTEYRYVNGWENGVVIGLIQYPRFPRKVRDIKKMAMLLANKLLVGLDQNRVTVTTPHKSYLIENTNFKLCNNK